jgi:hypothetical protein
MSQRYDADAAATAVSRGVSLTLYVETGCRACGHARDVLERLEREFPGLLVRTVDLGRVSSDQIPEGVFAAPTFVLDDEVISLGTPTWERLAPLLRSALGVVDEGRRTEG